MSQRASLWLVGIGFGTAALAAILAVLSFAGWVHLSQGWFLLLFGAVIAVVALLSQKSIRDLQNLLKASEHQVELETTQLEEQRAAIDSFAEGLDEAIFICNARAEILYANSRACDLFRFRNPTGRSIIAVTLSEELQRLVIDAATTQDIASSEVVLTEPNERIGLAKAWTIDGSTRRIFLSIFEITEIRRLMRIRQDFVANVSHELRTPLTVIRAMAETLREEDEPNNSEFYVRYLDRITTEVDRLSTITSDLLVLSSAESTNPEKSDCDVASIWRHTVEELSPQAKEKGLSIGIEGPERLVLQANAPQMSQVAINLIQNAINYTNEGSIEVCITRIENRVVIEVTDTGIGISSENQSRIFERFYRVDKGRSRTSGGTGLGLSIARHIVESHGGAIGVESALNLGSTFTVSLPIDG